MTVSTDALYVVDDPTALSGGETAMQSRLTAAGFTVTLIDNADPAPSDVDDYGLVVVAKGSDSNLAGVSGGPGKYALATAPLLWMHAGGVGGEQATYDHYLVASTTACTSTAEIQDDVLTVHESTANLSVANHNIQQFFNGTSQYYWNATMVAGAVQRLSPGLEPGKPVGFTIESCDDLRVGTAPNRRAVLTWFGPALQFPTADGTAILDGFIAWCAAGTPCPRGQGLVVGFMSLG